MDSTGLYEAFRSDVVDLEKPYLWSDDEVWRYADAAYRMFVRLTGGVEDSLSEICEVPITAGEAVSPISREILTITRARLATTNDSIKIINVRDLNSAQSDDYGVQLIGRLDTRTGPVRSMVIGENRGAVRWIYVPELDDTAYLTVFRLPLVHITEDGQELDDVDEDHHIHLLDWMKHLAYKKQDAETFNQGASETARQNFEAYCAFARGEEDRRRHKPRLVTYGGI